MNHYAWGEAPLWANYASGRTLTIDGKSTDYVTFWMNKPQWLPSLGYRLNGPHNKQDRMHRIEDTKKCIIYRGQNIQERPEIFIS